MRASLFASFLGGFAVMGIELLASRLLAPVTGTSVLVWTNLIAVILLALACGAWLGGRIADRTENPGHIGYAFLAAGLLLFLLVLLTPFGMRFVVTIPEYVLVPLLAFMFLAPPATVLGAIPTMALRQALRELTHSGRVAGMISASGTLGSLIGTYLTGYVLIAHVPTDRIIFGLASLLCMTGILWLTPRRTKIVMPLLLIWSGVCIAWPTPPLFIPSHYSAVRVQERLYQGTSTRFLWMDTVAHAAATVQNPTRSVFVYDHTALVLMEALRPTATRMLAIGGGAFHLPRTWIDKSADRTATVIERDPAAIEASRRFFALRENPQLHIIEGDGRSALRTQPPLAADVLIIDAYADTLTIPWHLITKEAWEERRTHLAPHALAILNVIIREDPDDPASRILLDGISSAAHPIFPYAILLPTPQGTGTKKGLTNALLILSRQPIALPDFIASSSRMIVPNSTTTFRDALAPVEYLSLQLRS